MRRALSSARQLTSLCVRLSELAVCHIIETKMKRDQASPCDASKRNLVCLVRSFHSLVTSQIAYPHLPLLPKTTQMSISHAAVLAALLFAMAVLGDPATHRRAKDKSQSSVPRLLWNASRGFGGVYGQPALFEGLVIVAHQNAIVAYDAFTGATAWSNPLGGSRQTSAVLHKKKGLAFVGSWTGTVSCFNATSGSVLWTYNTGGIVAVAPVVTDDALYSASTSGSVRRHELLSGAVQWETSSLGDINCRGEAQGGAVFFGAEGVGYQNRLFALRQSDGSLIWKGASSSEPFSERLDVADGVVYSGNYGGQVQAHVAVDGTLLWTRNASESWSSPLFYRGSVYAACRSGIEQLDASNGQVVYTTALRGPITYSVPVQAKGIIYVATAVPTPVVAAVIAEDGMVQWQFPLATDGATAAVSDLYALYIGDVSGTIYALGLID